MKKLHYYKEKTKYFHLAVILLFSYIMIYLYLIRKDKVDAIILLFILMILVQMYECFEGIVIMYKKLKCKSKGTLYEGMIIGKIGHSTHRKGYFYQLVVLYSNGKVKTPYIQSKLVDKIKSKKCKVYEYNKITYIEGFELCNKGEKGIDIRIIKED